MNKKLLVGGLGLAVIGLGSLAFISKPIYQEVSMNNLESEKIALYIKNETGNYEKTNTIPTSGYILNETKSRCNNNAKPSWNKTTNSLKIKDLSNDNTSCFLYFDKQEGLTSQDIIAANNPKSEKPDFSQVATTDEGVYKVEDGMYGGYSYYWRGAVTTNYVKFANFCWRIIRINGDGSIRIIYDGTTCHDNGTSTTESIAVANQAYNINYNQSNYVGWTYEGTSQRTLSGTASNAKIQLESWYSSNITGTNATKVAQGKYCNDRDAQSGSTWTINGSTFYYAEYKRMRTDYAPTLSCSSGDTYILDVGLITVDEVMYAGGLNASNLSYYLYDGQNYWTMSPRYWDGTRANVVFMRYDGYLASDSVGNNTFGLRPVINLRADALFTDGNGTLDNPYVVEGA